MHAETKIFIYHSLVVFMSMYCVYNIIQYVATYRSTTMKCLSYKSGHGTPIVSFYKHYKFHARLHADKLDFIIP